MTIRQGMGVKSRSRLGNRHIRQRVSNRKGAVLESRPCPDLTDCVKISGGGVWWASRRPTLARQLGLSQSLGDARALRSARGVFDSPLDSRRGGGALARSPSLPWLLDVYRLMSTDLFA